MLVIHLHLGWDYCSTMDGELSFFAQWNANFTKAVPDGTEQRDVFTNDKNSMYNCATVSILRFRMVRSDSF